METDKVKLLFAVGIALVIGFICEILAPEEGGRNWVSLAVTALTLFVALALSIAVKYDNKHRGVSIKVLAWFFTLALVLCNVIFSCFTYNIDVYIAVTLLLTLVDGLIVYALVKLKN